MKKLLLIFILHCSSITFGQKSERFWGFKLGDNKDSVKSQLSRKFGKQICEHNTVVSNGWLSCDDCIFAEIRCHMQILYFHNKIHIIYFTFTPDSQLNLLYLYDDIKSKIINIYGMPTLMCETYKYPYKKGDGNESSAVKNDSATVYSLWKCKNKTLITITVQKNLTVNVGYSDDYDESKFRKTHIKY